MRNERLLGLASLLTIMFGLGAWTIAKLDQLGGRIDVASEVDAGSIFNSILPVAFAAGYGQGETYEHCLEDPDR